MKDGPTTKEAITRSAGDGLFSGEFRERLHARSHRALAGATVRRENLPRYWLIAWFSCVALRFAPGQTAVAAYVGLAVLSSRGAGFAILGLATSFFFTLLNPQVAPAVPGKSQLRYLVIFGAAIGVFARTTVPRKPRDRGLIEFTSLILILLLANAVLVSSLPTISALKAISFGTTFATLLCAWSWMSLPARESVEQAIFFAMLASIAASTALSLVPQGYPVGAGLGGVFGHPQVLGPFAGIVGSIVCVRCATTRPIPRIDLSALAACLFLILRSRARTGAMAFLGGTGLALVLASGGGLGAARARLFSSLGAIALVSAIALGPGATAEVANFARKDSGATQLGQIARSSRGALVDAMLDNFKSSPFVGIGFGAPTTSLAAEAIEEDPIFGLPISVAVEKGVMPLALLEEVGLPLAILVFVWLATMARQAYRAGPLPAAVFGSAMFTNLSESTFFSIGGFGLFVLLCVLWAATSPPSTSRPTGSGPQRPVALRPRGGPPFPA